MTASGILDVRNRSSLKVPTDAELDMLAVGRHMVRLIAGGEKFWLTLMRVDGEALSGRIENDLENGNLHGLARGDIIEFERRHVAEVCEIV